MGINFPRQTSASLVRSVENNLLQLRPYHAVPSKDHRSHRTILPTKLKLLYVISDLSIGGAEMMLYKLLAKTDLVRFEPVVISLIDRGALRERIEGLGVAVHTLKMKPGLPSPLGLWRLIRLMRRLKPDLVLGWMYHSCLAAQLASFFLPRRPRVVWSIHYSISSLASEKRLTAAVIRVCAYLSKLANHLIFVSQASQTQHKSLGFSIDRSSVIPNGINVAEFVPSGAARSSVKAELGLAESDVLIGFMGRYHPMKDHANFLEAAALLSKKCPQVHFLLTGRGVDDQNPWLRRSIRELGLAGQTHLLGERHDIPRIAAALDVFSISSYGESCPNVIGEAMACEVPCVVTDVGDAGWIVGDTGQVVSPRNARALADAWKDIIDLGLEGRAALGREARSRVVERFTLESVVARYHDLYEAVLATGSSESIAAAPTSLAGITNLTATFEDTVAQ
jgi:glycosyltransferase involved in cell wall biosynthesis